MQHNIIKLCADALRAFLDANHGVKLKSGHAHEIIAAVFGYNSCIALHADRMYPITRLEEAAFILLLQDRQLLSQRLRCLNQLPENLPSCEVLVQSIYSTIANVPVLSAKVQTNVCELAVTVAKEPVYGKLKALGITPNNFNWQLDVKAQHGVSEILIEVFFDYLTDSGECSRYGKVDVKLPRIAGNIGYAAPNVLPTYYSGRFKVPDFDFDFGPRSKW